VAWDFSTDPELQEKLDWMRDFVREEIWPLETLDLEYAGIRRAFAPLQEQVRARGLWAAHLAPELGGQGFGQVKLGLMHEILGSSLLAPFAFGNQAPDSGPDEVHRQSVARQILRGYQAPADGVPSEHVPTRRETARQRFAHLLEAVSAND